MKLKDDRAVYICKHPRRNGRVCSYVWQRRQPTYTDSGREIPPYICPECKSGEWIEVLRTANK
jgi:hypothetical protein